MKCKIYLITSLAIINSSWINILCYSGIFNQYNKNVIQPKESKTIYASYYVYPTRLKSGLEKEATAGQSNIPPLVIIKTETIKVPNMKKGRQATKITYNIQATIDQFHKQIIATPSVMGIKDLLVRSPDPVQFNISQRIDNNNNPVFIMQLPKRYLANGLLNPFKKQWGPWWREIQDMGDYWEFTLNYYEIHPQSSTQAVPAA